MKLLRSLIYISILGSVWVCTAAQALDGADLVELERIAPDRTRALGELIRCRADYIRALYAARLDWARSRFEEARTAGEWERSRSLKLLVDRQDLVLWRMRKDEYKVRTKIERAETVVNTANSIMTGRLNIYSMRALREMQARLVPPSDTRAAMTAPVGPLGAHEFKAMYVKGVPKDFPGGNTGQLLEHLRVNLLTVVPWGEAHLAVVGALEIMYDRALERVAVFQELLGQLSEGVGPFKLPPKASVHYYFHGEVPGIVFPRPLP